MLEFCGNINDKMDAGANTIKLPTTMSTKEDPWDPGQHYDLSYVPQSSCYTQWDPGGVFQQISAIHLEDKVNL